MTHLVMIEIAKLRKPVRERVIELCSKNLCLCCEQKPQHARGRCTGCLNEVYQGAKYLPPLEQAKRVSKWITAGTLLGAWDKSHKPKRCKPVATQKQSRGLEAG